MATWLLIIGLIICVLLFAAAWPLFGGPMIWPDLTLLLIRKGANVVQAGLNLIRPGLGYRLLVKAVNRHYADRFAAVPFAERIMFLPYCLRPANCPAEYDPKMGMVCRGDCPDCRLGEVRAEALELGYGQVFIVPSSRLVRNQGLLPSHEFMKTKIKELAPQAAFGVVCEWHLKNRFIPSKSLNGAGLKAGPKSSVLQGVLLNGMNCKAAQVDWSQVQERMRLNG